MRWVVGAVVLLAMVNCKREQLVEPVASAEPVVSVTTPVGSASAGRREAATAPAAPRHLGQEPQLLYSLDSEFRPVVNKAEPDH